MAVAEPWGVTPLDPDPITVRVSDDWPPPHIAEQEWLQPTMGWRARHAELKSDPKAPSRGKRID